MVSSILYSGLSLLDGALPEGNVLGFDAGLLQEIVITLINVTILVVILAFILNKPLKKFLQDRKDRIAGQIADAQTKLRDAEDFKKQYEQKLAGADTERDEILNSAKSRAQLNEKNIIAEAQKEAESIKQRAALDIEREQSKLRDDFKTQLVELSALIAGKYLQEKMDSQTQNRILNDTINGLGDVKWLG